MGDIAGVDVAGVPFVGADGGHALHREEPVVLEDLIGYLGFQLVARFLQPGNAQSLDGGEVEDPARQLGRLVREDVGESRGDGADNDLIASGIGRFIYEKTRWLFGVVSPQNNVPFSLKLVVDVPDGIP